MTHSLKRPVEDGLVDAVADEPRITSHTEPSWFFQGDDGNGQMELAERYRRLRPERLAQASRNAEPLGYRDLISAQRLAEHREGGPPHRRQQAQIPRRASGMSVAKTYVFAALAAALAGGGMGYGASQFDRIKATVAGLLAGSHVEHPALAVAEAAIAPAQTTELVKKPVAIAKLDVADASGGLNTYIPLALHAEPGLQDQALMLKLTGLPETAYLTAGTRDRQNIWQLSPADLKDLKLVVPTTATPRFDVAVAAFEPRTGELLAPVKEMTIAIEDMPPVIVPTSAPAEWTAVKPAGAAKAGEAAAIPLPEATIAAAVPVNPEGKALLGKGDMLFKSGDLHTARQFYEQAFAKGVAEGALGVGRTYDPAVFAELKVQGLKADAKLAAEWYQRAAAAGSSDASLALAKLGALPK